MVGVMMIMHSRREIKRIFTLRGIVEDPILNFINLTGFQNLINLSTST